MKLLLISNSGRPYLEHCREEIARFLSPVRKVSFIAAAAFLPQEEYVEKVQAALTPTGIEVDLLDLADRPTEALVKAEGLLVGGGNTYKLLKNIREAGLLEPIRKRVREGMPFVGWSAGSNIAGPTILTTNDWNVVGLSDFGALNLVPFNINPHYLETDAAMAAHSETRDERIAEYHQANTNTVLGIEEQTWVTVVDEQVQVGGAGRVRRFNRSESPSDFRKGEYVVI